ncbi:hypothetical protein ACFWAR_29815 [Streptomyces sp. NPDC059917]|uniref:hypothetical protein n=1 Tax=Streptomyces sp. NPDC059917 TaxID=3347002 RepID=UPI003669C5BF
MSGWSPRGWWPRGSATARTAAAERTAAAAPGAREEPGHVPVVGGERAIAVGGAIGLGVSGDGNRIRIDGDVVIGRQPARPRSAYWREIRHLAAVTRFEGRAEELAAMAAFAAAPDGDGGDRDPGDGAAGSRGYWRWLGPAWAGKTALMAQFALHPPDGVDVLAFFITARMTGRADRTAFLTTLQGQLRTYLQDGDVDCTAPGGFLDALARAADRARGAGRRLVLVVDGMDEDMGVPTAVGGQSIAACLPQVPPPGLRIVLAGRPHPPVPADVRTGPLLTTAIDHPLTVSPAAQAVRADAERNLEALIASGGLGLELVGLTAAAGGGLSPADFADLTTASRRRVELVLGGSTGRAFQHRPAQWATDAEGRALPLYAFAHQDLLTGARDLLDPAELDAHRARIHAWAEGARAGAWPTTCPDYLLSGYPRLLHERADTARLTALATDRARHERLWQTTGTDSQAFSEIAAAFQLHLAAPDDPDLADCVRLAHRRESLQHTADVLPATVITTWARLGHLRRAITAATHRSHPPLTPGQTLLGSILTAAGTTAEATEQVIEAARALATPEAREGALAEIAQALAAGSRWDDAIRVAASVTDPDQSAQAVTSIAVAMGAAGEHAAATGLARGVGDTELRAHALTSVARAMAEAGDHGGAAELARTIQGSEHRATALTVIAWIVAEGGDHAGAVRLAGAIGDPGQRGRALSGIAVTMAEAGAYAPAVELAGTLGHPEQRAQAIRGIAVAMAESGEHDHEARELAHGIADPEHRAWALAEIARAMAAAGDHDGAVESARTVGFPEQRAWALAEIARTMAAVRETAGAVELARSLADPEQRAWALTGIARATAENGDRGAAVALARTITDADARASAYEGIVTAAARTGHDGARGGADHEASERVTALVTDLVTDLNVLGRTAETMAEEGDAAAAERLAEVTARLAHGSAAAHQLRLLAVAVGAAAAVEPAVALDTTGLVAAVLGSAGAVSDHEQGAWALTDVAGALAEADAMDAAVDLAAAITHADARARAYEDVAVALAAKGRHAAAVELTALISVPSWRARGTGRIAARMARQGKVGEALALAGALTHPTRRQEARAGIALALAESGDRDAAVAHVATLTLPVLQARTLASVARFVAADRERREEAFALVDSIPHAELRAEALAAVAVATAESGDRAAAAELARTLTDEDDRAEVFAGIAVAAATAGEAGAAYDIVLDLPPKLRAATRTDIAVALAGAGLTSEALDLARALPHPGQRARALGGISRVTGAPRLLAEALALSFDPALVAHLAAMDARALRTLVRGVLDS